MIEENFQGEVEVFQKRVNEQQRASRFRQHVTKKIELLNRSTDNIKISDVDLFHLVGSSKESFSDNKPDSVNFVSR